MLRLMLILAMTAVASIAEAKNLAIPKQDPAITLKVPDSWKLSEIDYGYKVMEPEEDIAVYIEATETRNVDALAKLNAEWLKDQGISVQSKSQSSDKLAGLDAQFIRYKATDGDGPTNVSFLFAPISGDRFLQFTVWGSDEEEQKHDAAISAIFDSVKLIK